MRFLFLLCAFVCASLSISAQVNTKVFGPVKLQSGFEKAVFGEQIPYFSIYPDDAKIALLTRCTDGRKVIEWQTAPLSFSASDSFVYVSWIAAFSTGTSKSKRYFTLYLNDSTFISIQTYPREFPETRIFEGKNGAAYAFELVKKDWVNDSHGIAYLKIPTSLCKNGQPLNLKLVGAMEKSQDWMMTFCYSYTEKAEIRLMPFILKSQTPSQVCWIRVLHFGENMPCKVKIDGIIDTSFMVTNGINKVTLSIPMTSVPKTLKATIQVNQLKKSETLLQKPVKPYEIAFLHHSHTDIGYSHHQSEVIQIHIKNIRDALNQIERTKNYPAGSRFKWNIESAWALENFWAVASKSEKAAFVAAVKAGAIDVSATYANFMSGLSFTEEMEHYTDYTLWFSKTYGIKFKSAMLTDVPGMQWGVVDALTQDGVKYFSNGPNYIASMPDKGDRIGQTLQELGDKAYYWKSTTGKDSLLFWTCGRGYSSWHGYAAGQIFDNGDEKIATYLDELTEKNYPYNIVQWRYNIVSDNGPIDSTISDFVRQWNNIYEYPKLTLETVSELFSRFESANRSKIPSVLGNFTPYWEDGALSTAKEEIKNRAFSLHLANLEKLSKSFKRPGDSVAFYNAWKYVLLFSEHTWGAHNSISEPQLESVRAQWNTKKSYLDSAEKYIKRYERSVLNRDLAISKFILYNTLPYDRPGKFLNDIQFTLPDFGYSSNGEQHYFFSPERTAKLDFYAYPMKKFSSDTIYFKAPKSKMDEYQLSESVMEGPTEPFKPESSFLNSKKQKEIQFIYTTGITEQTIVSDTLRFFGQQQVQRMIKGKTPPSIQVVPYVKLSSDRLCEVDIEVKIDKSPVFSKESLHLDLFPEGGLSNVRFSSGYGSWYSPNINTLPGSNREFMCAEKWVYFEKDGLAYVVISPENFMYEFGKPVNEIQNSAGVKTWNSTPTNTGHLYAYLFNNYWHTNFKASQSGLLNYHFKVYVFPIGTQDPERLAYLTLFPHLYEFR